MIETPHCFLIEIESPIIHWWIISLQFENSFQIKVTANLHREGHIPRKHYTFYHS